GVSGGLLGLGDQARALGFDLLEAVGGVARCALLGALRLLAGGLCHEYQYSQTHTHFNMFVDMSSAAPAQRAGAGLLGRGMLPGILSRWTTSPSRTSSRGRHRGSWWRFSTGRATKGQPCGSRAA